MRYLLLLLCLTSVSCFGQSANNSLVGKWVGYYDGGAHVNGAHPAVDSSAIILVFKKDNTGSLSETDKNGHHIYLLNFNYKISNQNRVSWTYAHTRYIDKEVSEFTIENGVMSLKPYPPKLRESIATFYLATYKKLHDF